MVATKALEGVTVLTSPTAAFENDAVVTMLSDDTAVRSVIIDSGALACAWKDCVHVMMSTISLALVEELQELHRSAGIAYVERATRQGKTSSKGETRDNRIYNARARTATLMSDTRFVLAGRHRETAVAM